MADANNQPQTGAILIQTVPADPNVGNSPQAVGVFDPPVPSKWLTIDGISGTVLTVHDDVGHILHFDFSTHTFS